MHYVIVSEHEDCTPDLLRGLLAVCGLGAGGSFLAVLRLVVWRMASKCGAVAFTHSSACSGSARWSFSVSARRRCVFFLLV